MTQLWATYDDRLLIEILVCLSLLVAVQNERQPRNTATIRPETFREMEQGHALREAAVAVGVFRYVLHTM